MTSKATVEAKVNLNAAKSQTLLVIFSIISVICMCVGFFFLWNEKSNSWVPLSIGGVVFFAEFIGWFKSQQDTDHDSITPTYLKTNNGNELTTDSRVLKSPESVQAIAGFLQSISNREPLPEPDGLVSSSGEIVPNSKGSAVAKVNEANREAQAQVKAFESACGKLEKKQHVELYSERPNENIAHIDKLNEVLGKDI